MSVEGHGAEMNGRGQAEEGEGERGTRQRSLILNREAAVRRMDDDEALFEMFLDLFIKGTPPRIEELADAVNENDACRLERVAHMVKGGAATSGAERVRDAAFRLEIIGRNGDMSAAARALAELRAEFDALICYLKSTSTPDQHP
mgnify:CR=1 FL=1